jgi:hypothetical protein
MKTRWILLLLCAGCLAADEPRHTGMVMPITLSDKGLYIVFNTWCSPPMAGTNPFACLGSDGIGGTFRLEPYAHLLSAQKEKTWFGYTFSAEKTGNGDSIRLSIGPASASAGPTGYTQVPLPKFNGGPFTIAPGDIVRMPLLVNPSTGQTLIDEMQIFTHPVSIEDVFGDSLSSGPARDFTLQDVRMKWLGGTALLNGKEVKSMGDSGATGAVIWYSYDGVGTAALSFLPQAAPGFQKAGIIRGRTLQFSIGPDKYEWRCAEPILPGAGVYNLYVYFDPRPVPPGGHGATTTGEQALKVIADLGAQ